jgi:hypothetical protein
MNCLVELWGSSAFISTEQPDKGNAWLSFSFPRKVELSTHSAQIVAPDLRELSSCIRKLPDTRSVLKSLQDVREINI